MTYRGKYPTRIHTVYSDNGMGMVARTNAGNRYRILPRTLQGCRSIPQLGVPIDQYIQSPDYSVHALAEPGDRQ